MMGQCWPGHTFDTDCLDILGALVHLYSYFKNSKVKLDVVPWIPFPMRLQQINNFLIPTFNLDFSICLLRMGG